MKKISKNYYGNVYKTSNSGFSVKRESERLKKIMKEAGADIYNEDSSQRTGSVYFDADYKGNAIEVRISNHSKRMDVFIDEAGVNNDKFLPFYFKYNIQNTKSFNDCVLHFNSL